MRFIGLVDSGGAVYQRWRVPNPVAPYPQDYIIDQQGIVRYWSDEYDPQAVIAVIDRLLASGVEEARESGQRPAPWWPTVVRRGSTFAPPAVAAVYDACGRLRLRIPAQAGVRLDLPAGAYLVKSGSRVRALLVLD